MIENRKYPNDNYVLAVRAPEIADQVRPGQFVMAAEALHPILPSPLLKRALAVYTIEDGGHFGRLITLLLRVVGDGTHRLARLRPGDRLELVGPLGNGFDISASKGKLTILVAGGTGIASVYLLARELLRNGEEVLLIYGGRSHEDLVGIKDFESLNIPIIITTEDGSAGIAGMVTDGLTDQLERISGRHLHVVTCGPNPMMKAVAKLALAAGGSCHISVEAKMACGFGVCLGCTVKTQSAYRLACTHGPVFDAAEFVWEDNELAIEPVRL
ncbi:MAG TPA: dihydroorotate dehydrogenase electron transfer subunit [Acidobacteriota bacterium]|nr:dihydroorotate dehydrogenase electron transfer subunit [Acidobacteriota bacterium]